MDFNNGFYRSMLDLFIFIKQIAKPAPDPFIKKRLEEGTSNKRIKLDDDAQSMSIEDKIKLSTTPLWNMPYSSQVRQLTIVYNEITKDKR